jgi:hypothetical protein
MDLVGPLAQLHARGIGHNSGQPCGHLRLTSELVDVLVSGQECVLNRILRIRRIFQKTISASEE